MRSKRSFRRAGGKKLDRASQSFSGVISPVFQHVDPRVSAACAAVLANLAFLPMPVYANCSTSGAATTCDTSAPTPWTSTIGSGASTAGATVTIQPNAQVSVGDRSAISVGDNANITVNPGATVQNAARSNNGLYNTGANTIDFRNSSTLTVQQGGTVLSAGTQAQAEAVNPEGAGNLITNNGTIRSINGAAIWFQNNSGLNTVVNNATGVIQSPGSVIGASGNGAVDFTNRGQVIGNLTFAGGNDSLHLYTGSVITGNFDGGGGNNVISLNGTGTGTLPGNITRFQTLYKQDSGTWTLTGAIAGVNLAEVQGGTLALSGNNTGYTGQMIVDPAGTLQAPSQSLPPTVTDNGLVQFTQGTDGTYAGLISGTGTVEKTGAGTLTLAPSATGGNTYSGGTVLTQGVLAASADSALGAPTGGVTFNGGTLQLGSSFDLAATRPMTINAAGGTIDTQGFQSTVAQNITGAGGLTKLGSGTLLLNGANTYSGSTSVSEGALGLGDAAHAGASLGSGAVGVAAGATFGGYGRVAGDVNNSGTLAVANAFPSFSGGGHGGFAIAGRLTNAGTVQIGGGQTVGNTLTVGSYLGQGGTIALNTFLGTDNSPSDKLVVNGGSATGTTLLKVTNVGGPGAATTSSGIQVVQATNGGTTGANAFTLDGGTVKAGAYEYFLARGGVSADSTQDWYLRNSVPVTGTGSSPVLSPPGSSAGAGGSGSGAGAGAGAGAGSGAGVGTGAGAGTVQQVPLYRPEVAVDAAIPGVARQLGLLQIDNFHDRAGDQSLLSETGTLPAAWGRVWGGHNVLGGGGQVSPEFDGSVVGAQAGHDIYADSSPSGHRNHYGFFVGFARATGDVDGSVLGEANAYAGHLAINSYSLGGYWTHIGPGGWYTDAVLMGSSLTVDPVSRDGLATTTHGTAVTGSIEGGLPIPVGYGLTVEPQAQLVWQRLSINDFNDGVSSVGFNSGNTFLGRLGVRVAGNYSWLGTAWQPYVRLNLLRSFGASNTTTFGGVTPIGTDISQTAGQIGAGVVAKLTKQGSAFATVSYITNLGGVHQRTITGDAGVRWAW